LSGIIAFNAFKIMKENNTDINYNKPTTKIIIKGSFHTKPFIFIITISFRQYRCLYKLSMAFSFTCFIICYFQFCYCSRGTLPRRMFRRRIHSVQKKG
jgi:hypothetical protein